MNFKRMDDMYNMKKRKLVSKIESLALAILILLSIFVVLVTGVAGNEVLTIGSIIDAETGENYTISISIDDAEYVTGVSATLVYDSSVVNVVSIESNDSVFNSSITTGGSEGNKTILLINSEASDYITTTEDTPIIDVTLTIVGSSGSSTALDLQDVDLSDTSFDVFPPSTVNDGEVITKPLTISIYTDKTEYTAGDTMYVGLDMANYGPGLTACVAVWLENQTGSIIAAPVHSHNTSLPSGFEYSNSSFLTYTNFPNIEAGNYTWNAAIMDPPTHSVIVEDTAEWEFVSAKGGTTEDLKRMLEQTKVEINLDN